MLNFRDFLTQDKNLIKEEFSHEQIADIGDKLDSVKGALLGKKTSAKLTKEFPGGIPITFGVDPKTKKLFVSHNGMKHFSIGDIESAHGTNNSFTQALSDVLSHGHKIIPRSGGVYNAKYYKFNKKDGTYNSNKIAVNPDSKEGRKIKNSAFSLFVHSKHDISGNPKPIDPSKLEDHPDVHVMDHHVSKVSPSEFSPEEQGAYTNHMLHAKNSYSKLDPEFFERVGNHTKELNNFVQSYMGDKPPKKADYIEYLKNKFDTKMSNQLGNKQKDNVARQLNDLLHTVNEKGFDHLVTMMHHVHGANSVLRNVANKQHTDYAGDIPVMVHHKGNKTPL